jgi:rubrerythrin
MVMAHGLNFGHFKANQIFYPCLSLERTMSMKNDVREIMKTALFNEVKAAAFYDQATEFTQNDAARMLFIELAGMEDDHAGALADKAKQDKAFAGFDAEAYLRTLESTMETTVPEHERQILETGSLEAILDLAIGLETNARDTYRALIDAAVSAEVRSFCKQLAKEEEKHRQQLVNARNNLTMDMDARPGL